MLRDAYFDRNFCSVNVRGYSGKDEYLIVFWLYCKFRIDVSDEGGFRFLGVLPGKVYCVDFAFSCS